MNKHRLDYNDFQLEDVSRPQDGGGEIGVGGGGGGKTFCCLMSLSLCLSLPLLTGAVHMFMTCYTTSSTQSSTVQVHSTFSVTNITHISKSFQQFLIGNIY